MAKKKSKRTKYTTAGRVDMSKGGRVAKAVGGRMPPEGLRPNPEIDPPRNVVPPKGQSIGDGSLPVRKPNEPKPKRPVKPKIPQPAQAPAPTPGGGRDPRMVPENYDEERVTVRPQPAPAPIPAPALQTQVIGEPEPVVTPQPKLFDFDPSQVVDIEKIKRDAADRVQQNLEPQTGLLINPATNEEWAWVSAGYTNVQDALADGWTYDQNIGDFVPPTSTTTQDSGTTPTPSPTPAPTPAPTPSPEQAEEQRQVDLARQSAEAAARGEVPEAAKIPEAVKVSEDIQQQITEMAEPTAVSATIAQGVAPENVVTVDDVAQAKQIDPVAAAQMEAAKVNQQVDVGIATGEIQDEALAKAANVERVAPIEGAEVEIIPGALTDRVIGTISEEAKSKAAVNAGSSLARITRAKKQLANAGLSEADITELGNDPEALEARLADFSEEQRGIIEGLPQEALVSNQMDSLLSGIENGEIPTWARPAVAQVEQMLAQRGLSASTVGRDSLFNAIIQSAIPLAQSNAQAIQQSVAQQRTIEAQEAEANAARRQQTALTNAQNVFQMDMAQFSSDQQIALSNSKFLQTVGLTEANNQQQATIQNATIMAQMNLAEADFYQKAQIQNAQAFLQMDMQNLSNEQQSNVLRAQQEQQRMLSNQAAENAARQFNATNEQQTQQFMASLNAQVDQFNVQQMNSNAQFNATQANSAEARRVQRLADVDKFNAQLRTQVDQFNANQEFARAQWNAQNQAAVEASNVQWRRQANTANTAMQNQINMQNAQNAFGLSQTAMSFLWQELRDQADYDFRNTENEKNRIAQLVNTALASDPSKYTASLTDIKNLISSITGDIIG